MKSLVGINGRHLAWLGLSVALLAFALACGAAEQPTPTPTQAPVAVPTATAVATPTPTPVGGVPKRGGSIVMVGGEPAHWDAGQNCCPTDIIIDSKLYLTFMLEDGVDKYLCDICDEWRLEDGGKTMVFKLRDDVKFHDGTPITAKDLQYSLDKLMGKIDNVANIRMGYIKTYVESTEVVDNRTFKIRFIRPSPIAPPTLSVVFAVIYPEGTKRADLSAPPIGPNNKYTSGPFYVKEVVPGSHHVFERSPGYFKAGQPYLDQIKNQVITDGSAQMTALLVGKADIYQSLDAGSPQFWPQLEQRVQAGTMKSLSQPLWCSIGNVWLNFDKPLMQDKRVRQAINLAFDRDEFGTLRYGGRYLATTFFPVNTTWGKPDMEVWDVLPGFGRGAKKKAEREQAKKLLADAGFPNGFDLEILTAYTGIAAKGAETMQRGLKSIGINATIDFDRGLSQRWAAGDYTLLDRRLCLATGDPDEAHANYFLPGGPRNLMNYKNQEIIDLFQQLTSESDLAKRVKINMQMVDILLEDVAAVNLTDGSQTYWFNGKLRGIKPGTTIYGTSANRADAWWLDQ